MDPRHLEAWLAQAEADCAAGRAGGDGISECHRRYWLQQACEKGIKALGLLLWEGPPADEGAFRSEFLYKHSPLKNLQGPGLPKSLKLLLRRLEEQLNALDGERLLRKVDATTPSTKPAEISYRYPFEDAKSTVIAPVWFTEWDAYQGNHMGVVASIDRFLKAVRNRVRKDRSRR